MNLFNVKNLVQSEIGATEKFEVAEDISDFDLPDEIEGHFLKGKLTLMRLEDGIVASGNFQATITVICDRCLDNFDTQVNLSIEREYILDRKEINEEVLYVDKFLNIDIAPELRDEIILAVPTQNFCSKDCPGICPTCGVNLNHEPCKCNNKKTEIEE